MKKIISSVCLLVCSLWAAGQEDSLIYRHGKLENGLTYYVRHTDLQPGKADFYLVQNVGALMEEDYQNGLAHFLEHMAFNGTEHFPHGVKGFLNRQGITHFNAYTGQNETVYHIDEVPTVNWGLIDSCLLILRDWSGFLLLNPKEVDKERGVILEERRLGRDVNGRIQEQVSPYLYNHSKYVVHNTIGDPQIIQNCSPQDIRDYYHDYYRPDQQAVIVVGDIDASHVEAEIHRLFAPIPKRVNPKPRLVYEIPDNVLPFYCRVNDPEIPAHSMQLIKRIRNHVPGNLEEMMKDNLLRMFYNRIVIRDLSEYIHDQSPDFLQTSVKYGPLVRNYSVLDIMLKAFPGKERTALKQLMEELERIDRFVLNETTLQRQITGYLQGLDETEQSQDELSNDIYIKLYQNNFLEGKPVTTIAEDITLSRKILAGLTVNDLREWMGRWNNSDQNWIFVMQGNDPAYDFPTADEIMQAMHAARKASLKPWNTEVKPVALMDFDVCGGKIVKEKKIKALDAEVWTLSNGCRVCFKQTDTGDGSVGLHGESAGGMSLLADEDLPSAEALPDILLASGLYHHTAKMMEAILKGHQVSVQVNLGDLGETVNGSAVGEDVEMMFQWVYLAFEKPRFDRDYFDKYVYVNKLNYQNTPRTAKDTVWEAIRKLRQVESSRLYEKNGKFYDAMNFDRMQAIYADRFRDASDFTFYLVGDIGREKARDWVARYLGALPSIHRKETPRHYDLMRKGSMHETIEANIPDDKYMINIEYKNHLKTNLEEMLSMQILRLILRERFTRTIREDEGGTYGINVAAKTAGGEQNFGINFDSSLEKGDRMRALVFQLIDRLCREGVDEEEVEDQVMILKKGQREASADRGLDYWMHTLIHYAHTGKEEISLAGFEKAIDKIRTKDIRTWANRFFKTAECTDIVVKSNQSN